MLVFMTGATGFIGSRIAAKLRERGDDVRAIVRSPVKAEHLRAMGCELVEGDLSSERVIRTHIEASDAAIHAAAMYRIGIPEEEHAAMYEANVEGTDRVLRAASDLGVPRVLHVSSAVVYGNTRGEVVDERHQRTPEFTSYYEATKLLAHKLARRYIDEEGLPCLIACPGVVYGHGDTSDLGNTVQRFIRRRLPGLPFRKAGYTFAHVDDVADGILLALDKGRVGEEYILGGEIATIGDMLRSLADALGRRPPVGVPDATVKALVPLGGSIGKLMGFPPNLREVISSMDEVTFWARSDKAIRELGYTPRPLGQGLRDMLADMEMSK